MFRTIISMFKSSTPGQPWPAPVALGGSMVAGIVTMLISGYNVVDCVRYQTSVGQCKQTVEQNLPGMVSGAATIIAGWGGFNTLNPKLRESAPPTQTKELVIPTPQLPHPEIIENLYKEGNSQTKIAEMLGISVYAVRKVLKTPKKEVIS